MVDKTRILLVHPRCLEERVTDEDATMVPIGLYYIAALLRDKGHDVAILNLAAGSTDPLALFRQSVKDYRPGTIGFSVMNPNRWNAVDCAKAAVQIDASVTIVFGGPAATFMADNLFENCPELDVAVKGEGEKTFLELIEHLSGRRGADLSTVRGIAYRKDGRVVHTPDREPLADLDLLPHPSGYFVYRHLSMSRGCPGNCTFCGSPKFWGQRCVRFHSARWFAEEIQALAHKGVRHFYISDDTFTMDKERVLSVCGRIERQVPGITWNAISRVDYIDEEILYAMRKAGCIQISYGVESGNKEIRKRLGKPIEKKKIIKAFAMTRRYGILPRAYFIYGSPGETEQTVADSVALMKQIMPLSAVFYMLVIFPGTHLYRSAVHKGQVDETVWNRKIEDIPWFDIDPDLDFDTVKKYGGMLRGCLYSNISTFARHIDLVDRKDLYPYHADFLSRLAMTFSHGEYAADKRIKDAAITAEHLYEKALSFAPDTRAFTGLAMLLQKRNNFGAAITLLETAMVHFPRHPDLVVCMGLCRMNMGRFDLALTHFERFNDLPQTQHYIQICKEKLTAMDHFIGARPQHNS